LDEKGAKEENNPSLEMWRQSCSCTIF
jgi:hypothetical protein